MTEFCCPQCFAEGYLRKSVSWPTDKVGTCSFCLSDNQPLKNPHELQMEFQPIIDLYCQGRGNSLATQIGNDWAIWSKKIKPSARARLLDAICGTCVSTKRYSLCDHDAQTESAKSSWRKFSEELKYKNRFFHLKNDIPNLTVFEKYIEQFKLSTLPPCLYRARVNEDYKTMPRPIDEMKKPPVERARGGRANPLGISYLYTASTIRGAIQEVKPHIGAYVSVVELQFVDPSAYIVDLRFLNGTISPFELEDVEAFSREIPLLKILDSEMSRAISPKQSELDYLPIQYLCESIKHQGAAGIAYKSVTYQDESNYNIVFFSDSRIEYKSIKCYYVSGNSIVFNEST